MDPGLRRDDGGFCEAANALSVLLWMTKESAFTIYHAYGDFFLK